MVKELIKHVGRRLGVDISGYRRSTLERSVVSLTPPRGSEGNVLLSYFTEPFLSEDGIRRNDHTEYWECAQIAKTFLDLGYSVDVIFKGNYEFVPRKRYAVFVDTYRNMERLAPLLDKDCVKILHLVWAHWLSNNAAEYERCLALQRRKGVTVAPRRYLWPSFSVEYTDYIVTDGNEFTVSTYSYAGKPIFRIHGSTVAVYPWTEDKNFEACRNHFLWFGGPGLVHKGLDLVLDAFKEMPDCHLTVCGPIGEEKDFERAYHEELYKTSNIDTVGWVDVESPRFLEIASKSAAIVFPSCAEACSAGVITCMHAGLIPIVSYETDVEVGDFGVMLTESAVEAIKESVRRVSKLPAEELRRMARGAWEYARANHTRERFAEEFKTIVTKILADRTQRAKVVRSNVAAEAL